MYNVIIPNSVKRELKKLDKTTIDTVIKLLDNLSIDPFQGI